MYKKTSAFTLVELIVVITILAILGTVAYVSFLGYNLIARDTVRISDINTITKVVELYKLEGGNFPSVTDPIDITFSGTSIWEQGTFGKESQEDARRISQVPIDPLTGTQYSYSLTYATSEYQVGAILEKSSSLSYMLPTLSPGIFGKTAYSASILPSFATTKINGNYNRVFITHRVIVSPTQTDIYILGVPTILASDITDTDFSSLVAGSRFAYEGGVNAPASYSGTLSPNAPWVFTPTSQNDIYDGGSSLPIGVIHKMTLDDVNTGSGKLALFNSMQSYYASVNDISSDILSTLESIDSNTQPNTAIEFVNQLILGNVGGIGYINAVITQVDTSGESGGDPNDPDCIFGTHNFGECNFG